jgi:hypothetical protein
MTTRNTNQLITEMIQKHDQRLRILEANSATIDAIAEDLQSINFNTFALAADSRSFDFSFSGTGNELKMVWSVLRNMRLEPSSRPRAGDASFYCYWRPSDHCPLHSEYDIACANCLVQLTVSEKALPFWMNFSSTQCRVIQKGTKMVEQAVYEVECESDLAQLIDEPLEIPSGEVQS